MKMSQGEEQNFGFACMPIMGDLGHSVLQGSNQQKKKKKKKGGGGGGGGGRGAGGSRKKKGGSRPPAPPPPPPPPFFFFFCPFLKFLGIRPCLSKLSFGCACMGSVASH